MTVFGKCAVWIGVTMVGRGLVCIVHSTEGTRWRVPAIVAACSAAALVLLIALRQPAAGEASRGDAAGLAAA